MKKILIILCLALVAQSQVAAKPDLVIISSPDKLHCNDTIAVFSPAGKRNDKGIKTVFLLHGWSGNWKDWSENMDLQKMSDQTGWRVITPDGYYDSWYFDNADSRKMQWRTSFWTEMWPELDRRYGLDPDKTFITGLSMGGHGAMNIFLDHPERFAGAGSMSGVLDLKASKSAFIKICSILGKSPLEDMSGFSAINRLKAFKKTPGSENKLLVITCGSEDREALVNCSSAFAGKCDELGLKHILMLSPGGHNWKYWPYIVYYHLRWFDEHLVK